METLLISLGIVSAALCFFLYRSFRTDTQLPLPPGPKPLPILGNIRSLPPDGVPEYLHWLPFKDKYGPISSITVLGQTSVILHGRKEVEHLLENMSTKTSQRPVSTFVNLSGFDRYIPSMQYDAIWRRHRKMMHQYFGTEKLSRRFNTIQDLESRRLLLRILAAPKHLLQHFKTEASAIILRITYGYTIEPHTSDPLVYLIEEMMDNLSKALIPLSWLVDIVPVLRFLPDYLPGASFKRIAKQWYAINDTVTRVPYSFALRQMAQKSHLPSFVSSVVDKSTNKAGQSNLDPETERTLVSVAGIMYGAGADTTSSVLGAFALAMVMFPDVQRRAQLEIDTIIGSRLPGSEDRESLPYVSAVVNEVMRWFPIVPMNTAHATNAEIHYNGYRIPKGSLLLVSNWWLLHDPEIYHDPELFDPERFLTRNEPVPATVGFGHGRRICPGRFIADKSLFITISRILATFTISKADGEAEAEAKFTPGLVAHPVEFPFEIAPRSAKHAELIKAIEKNSPWAQGDAGLLAT